MTVTVTTFFCTKEDCEPAVRTIHPSESPCEFVHFGQFAARIDSDMLELIFLILAGGIVEKGHDDFRHNQ
jgi:hypothetical protein